MNVKMTLTAGPDGLFFSVCKGILKYKKKVDWEDIVAPGKKKAGETSLKGNKRSRHFIGDLRKLTDICMVKVEENVDVPPAVYFKFYAFVFPFLPNVYMVTNKNMDYYIRLSAVIDMDIIKGGVLVWKKLLKYLKS